MIFPPLICLAVDTLHAAWIVPDKLVPRVLSPLTAMYTHARCKKTLVRTASQNMRSKIIINERGVRQYRFRLLTLRQNQSAATAKYWHRRKKNFEMNNPKTHEAWRKFSENKVTKSLHQSPQNVLLHRWGNKNKKIFTYGSFCVINFYIERYIPYHYPSS